MNKIEVARPIIFLSLIAVFTGFQYLKPALKNTNKKRVITNIGILIASTLLLKVVFPLGIASVSTWSTYHEFYLIPFHQLPYSADLILTIFLFDFLIYWQHRIMHLNPLLWRLHKVHHADHEMDVTTGFRFHPLEIIFSGMYKAFFLVIFAPRFEIFIIYEIILSSMALFNHSNFNVPADKWLRYFIVTPQMHFPHHSPKNQLMNLNFGNFLSIWDRIFSTYTNRENRVFGVKGITSDQSKSLWPQLLQPFKSNRP